MRSLDRTIGSLMTACNFKCIQFKLVLLLARYEWCIICETRHVMGLHVRITSFWQGPSGASDGKPATQWGCMLGSQVYHVGYAPT